MSFYVSTTRTAHDVTFMSDICLRPSHAEAMSLSRTDFLKYTRTDRLGCQLSAYVVKNHIEITKRKRATATSPDFKKSMGATYRNSAALLIHRVDYHSLIEGLFVA